MTHGTKKFTAGEKKDDYTGVNRHCILQEIPGSLTLSRGFNLI
jgi:hypothetical protein